MSDPSPAIVLVTFIGGPLHGTEQHLESPETTIWRTLPDGRVAAYGRRWPTSGEKSATDGSFRAVYAPVGMSEHAYEYMAGLVFKIPLVL